MSSRYPFHLNLFYDFIINNYMYKNCMPEKVSDNSSFMERDVLKNLGIFIHEEATRLVKHRVRCITVLESVIRQEREE